MRKYERVEIDILYCQGSIGKWKWKTQRYRGPADVLEREEGMFGGVLVRFRDPHDRRRYYMLTISPEEIVNAEGAQII